MTSTRHGSPGPKPATLVDVASLAGVSRATVSRVINASKFVEPQVAERVRTAITQTGYVPNHAARSLSTRRTDMVALIASEPHLRFFHDPFFADIVHGVAQELAEVDMRMIMSMIQSPDEMMGVQQYLMGRPVDGVLAVSEHTALQITPQLATARIPLVIGGRPLHSSPLSIAYVDNDNFAGARMATDFLLERGAKTVTTIAGPSDMNGGIDRLAGFRSAFPAPVAKERIAFSSFTVAGGADAMERLLNDVPDLDAVFAASDLIALGAMQTLRRAGKRVPEDVAIVGFDDIELACEASPPLTTIRQDSVMQGRMMVRLLLRALDRTADLSKAARASLPEENFVVLPVTLVQRASA
ncbi:MAG: LacI family DNA-binding transcriptional regulator [Arachnia sp.]